MADQRNEKENKMQDCQMSVAENALKDDQMEEVTGGEDKMQGRRQSFSRVPHPSDVPTL